MNPLIIGILVLVVVAGGLLFRKSSQIKPAENNINNTLSVTVIPTGFMNNVNENAPLPTREDLIRVFFELIKDKKISEAINMMDSKLVGDESSKQAWGVQLNSLIFPVSKRIEPDMKADWTKDKETYRVNINLEVSQNAKNAPIPYYGWENGDNTRWITLIRNQESNWKISEIATGP